MAISSTHRVSGPFSGNGITKQFPFTFRIFQKDQIVVVHTNAQSVESHWNPNLDYSVTLNANQDMNPGGVVTTRAALPASEKITIVSGVPELQPVVLTNQGGFYPRVINDALDRVTVLVQQLRERVSRAITVPVSSGLDPDSMSILLNLPNIQDRANQILGFDAAGNPIAVPVPVLPAVSGILINVKDLGADTTGLIDATPIFQQALKTQASTGRWIFVPAGKYNISGQLTYTAPVKLRGEGIDRTTLNCNHRGGATLVPFGSDARMPGTVIEQLSAIGPGPDTGTGEVFYQSQTAEANRNGVFRDLHVQAFNKAAFVITDSYDNYFSNLRLWYIGNKTTVGHGILHDRVNWSASDGYASTGNHYDNISCMHSFRGLGVTAGNQIIECHFKRITGEFCGGTIETYADPTPSGGLAGNCSFIGVYSEANLEFGIKAVDGTEIECYAANYPGSGNNASVFARAFTLFKKGVSSIGGQNPMLRFLNRSGDISAIINYNNALYKTQFSGYNQTPILALFDNSAPGAVGDGYVQIMDPLNTSRARIAFGVSGAFLEFDPLAKQFKTTNIWDFLGGTVTVSNQANPQIKFTTNAKSGTEISFGVNGAADAAIVYDVRAAAVLARYSSKSAGGKVFFPFGIGIAHGGVAATSGTATLAAGAVLVATTALTNNSRIFLSTNTPSGEVGHHSASVSEYVAGTSFRIRSTNEKDTSSVNWLIVDGV